ncbi:MAG: Hsp20/alpha crystallin family protein [candidate division NC10 bacterium]|nr:Hsp20/alpha crystallin family protein [candidate division NC10 bacterium]
MATQEKKEKESEKMRKEEPIETDLGLDKLSLGGIFRGLGNLIELAGKLAEDGEEIRKERVFTARGPGGKELQGIFGVSVRTLEGGKSVFETFGNLKKTPEGPVVEEVREPIVDLFDEKSHVRLIAELPGVSDEGLSIELKGDILNLNAVGKERHYAKEILLPCPVKQESLQKSFHNGILEITLEKA